MTVPLQWTVSIKGGNEVKATLAQLDEARRKQVITEKEYAQAVAQSGRQAGQMLNVSRQQEKILRAQFPALQKVSRAMSTLASISRMALTITNALNLARISGNLQDSATISIQNDLNAALRERDQLMKMGLEGSKAWIENEEEIILKTAELAEAHKKAADQFLIDMITTAGSIALVVNAAVDLGIKAIPEMKKFITAIQTLSGANVLASLSNLGKGFTDMFSKLGGGSTKRAIGGIVALGAGMGLLATGGFDALIGKSEKVEDKLKALGGIGAVGIGIALEVPEIAKIALIGTAIIVAITAIILFRKEIGDAFEYIAKHINAETVSAFFTETIPNAISQAGKDVYKFFVTDLPLWAGESWTSISSALAPLFEFFNSIFGPIIQLFTDLITSSQEDGGIFVAIWEGIKASISGVWTIITEQFTAFWNTLVTTMNTAGTSLTSGVNSIFGNMISALNSMITKYNSAATKMRQSTIQPIAFTPVSYTPIQPIIAAATGFNGMVNSPTMFLAGEAGPEQVSITPNGGGRSGSGSTLIINVGGSVVTERKLAQIVDQYQKQNLKSRGFTGFG